MDLKRFGFIGLIIVILFSVVVMVGQAKQPPLLIVTSMLATTIAVATPLTLGALSGVFCERSGVVNIGIEGMMLTSAFFGWLGGIYMFHIFKLPPSASIVLGVFFAILTGALMSLLHAMLSITFKVDQIIGGTVINILAIGLTGFLNRQLFLAQPACLKVPFQAPLGYSLQFTFPSQKYFLRYAAHRLSAWKILKLLTVYLTKNRSP